jgi:hypothetical protein
MAERIDIAVEQTLLGSLIGINSNNLFIKDFINWREDQVKYATPNFINPTDKETSLTVRSVIWAAMWTLYDASYSTPEKYLENINNLESAVTSFRKTATINGMLEQNQQDILDEIAYAFSEDEIRKQTVHGFRETPFAQEKKYSAQLIEDAHKKSQEANPFQVIKKLFN